MADVRLSTPPGIAVYPRLKTPDTKFDELGMYKADVSIPLAEAEPLMKRLQEIYKSHTGKPANAGDNTMWSKETDGDGNETGNVIFKLRIKNRMNKKGEVWDRKPKQFDASLKPINENPWGGSTMVVSFDVYQWVSGNKKGVSLQPVGVQILDLKSGSGPDASSMGFKAQQGYTAEVEEDDAGEYDMTDQSVGADDGDDAQEDGDY